MNLRQIAKLALLQLGTWAHGDHRSKIIFYHDIHPDGAPVTHMGTSLSLFKAHLKAIEEEGFEIVDEITQPERQVSICLDDGFRGLFEVRDFLREHNLHPTVFLAVDLIGQEGYLTIEEIAELQKQGVRFESHAWTHRNLLDVTDAELSHEITDSRSELSKILGRDVTEICFPIGGYSPKIVELCHKTGYTRMYSSVPGNVSHNDLGEGVVTRNLLQYATPREVRLTLRGGYNLLRNRYLKYQTR